MTKYCHPNNSSQEFYNIHSCNCYLETAVNIFFIGIYFSNDFSKSPRTQKQNRGTVVITQYYCHINLYQDEPIVNSNYEGAMLFVMCRGCDLVNLWLT